MDPILILNLILATGLVGSWVSHWLAQRQKQLDHLAKRKLLFYQLRIEVVDWLARHERGVTALIDTIPSLQRVLDSEVLNYERERELTICLIRLQNQLLRHEKLIRVLPLKTSESSISEDESRVAGKMLDNCAGVIAECCALASRLLPTDLAGWEHEDSQGIIPPLPRQPG